MNLYVPFKYLVMTIPFWGASSLMAATANLPADVTILPPVAIVVTDNLRFGSLSTSGTPATVTVAPPSTAASGANLGTRVASIAGVTLVGHSGVATTPQTCTSTSACGVAVLSISGGANSTLNTVTITPPAALINGANSVPFSAVTRVPSGTLVLDSVGGLTINIGGTIAIGASQAAGSYVGVIAVVLDY
jgi:Mat/Ecp fimbriae major subunit